MVVQKMKAAVSVAVAVVLVALPQKAVVNGGFVVDNAVATGGACLHAPSAPGPCPVLVPHPGPIPDPGPDCDRGVLVLFLFLFPVRDVIGICA